MIWNDEILWCKIWFVIDLNRYCKLRLKDNWLVYMYEECNNKRW
jgi:hypothetical protein